MLAVVGLLGALLAGMIVVDPFAGEDVEPAVETDEAESDNAQEAANEGTESILDTLDAEAVAADQENNEAAAQETDGSFSGFGQDFSADSAEAEDANAQNEGPDLEDQVYGHNIGDQKGAALFRQLLFSEDAITGAPGDDELQGSTDGDLMFGNEGNDNINTDAGNDLVHGDEGDDFILTGLGSDAAFGDDGNDRIETGSGDDLVVGGEGDDTLVGGDGDDRLFGQLGSDSLEGGAGNDILDGTYARTVSDPGTDEDTGDTLSGGDGNDLLILGSGDLASGGEGEDTFVTGDYIDEANIPVISDFDPDSDFLEVFVDPDDIGGAELTTHASGGVLEVCLDGVAIAQITNIQDLNLDRVRLIPSIAA